MKLEWGIESLTIDIQLDQQLDELPSINSQWLPISFAEALAQPTEFPTLERCATPDDRVVVAFDPSSLTKGFSLPCLLGRLATAGVAESQVTIILPKNSPNSSLNLLQGIAGDCQVERHDPKEPNSKVILGGTKDGQQVFLNRKIVEADLLIIISGTKRSNTEESPASLIFPGMACEPITNTTGSEVLRLLGTPYLIVGVEGPSGQSPKWFAGRLEAFRRAKAFRKQFWEFELQQPVNMIVITWPNETETEGFREWARAIFRFVPCLENGGRAVIVSSKKMDDACLKELNASIQTFQNDYEGTSQARGQNMKAFKQWFKALEKCSIFILNSIPLEICEDLQSNKISGLASIQKLALASERILVIQDPDRCAVIPLWKK